MTPEPAPAAALADPREWLRHWLVSGRLPSPASETEVAALVDAAREQRLIALLHAAVAAEGTGGWSGAMRERLADEHRRLLVRGVGQLDLMARVDALLAARGLRALPLKGAALAESLYASAAERPMGDVDALALDDWRASVQALEDAGMSGAERADHAWSFVDPVTRGLVELHRSVTSCPDVFALDREGLWARHRRGPGQVARVPSAEDLLVQLAQHALFQHAGVLSLVQWLDFRRLLERDPPAPARLAEVARAARATSCVGAALSAARAIVGGPEVAGLPDEARLPWGLRRWLEGVRGDPLVAVSPTPPPLARLRWAVAAGRRWPLDQGDPASRRRRARGHGPSRGGRHRTSRRRPGTSVGHGRPAVMRRTRRKPPDSAIIVTAVRADRFAAPVYWSRDQ